MIKEKMNKVVFVRLSEDEYREINEKAGIADISTSRYLVSCGLGQEIKKVRKAKRATGQEREKFEDLMWQLKKLQRNVSQLAYCYEDARLTGEGEIDQNKIIEVSEKIKSLLKQVEEHL